MIDKTPPPVGPAKARLTEGSGEAKGGAAKPSAKGQQASGDKQGKGEG